MRSRLSAAYSAAISEGRFADTYAITDEREYWAEAVQSYFDTNIEAIPANGIHNEINTRDELQRYDPTLATIIADVFFDRTWRPICRPRG